MIVVFIIRIRSARGLKTFNIRNIEVEIIPIAIMFIYSAIKISAKVPELYSVLKPETSSDSPSERSKGVRFVSANVVIIHVMNNGHSMIIKIIEFSLANELRLDDKYSSIGVKMTRAILISYEIVWAILRRAPSREYFLLEAHPENNVV
jgi:hypothetical protein